MHFIFVLTFGCMVDTMNALDGWNGRSDGCGKNNGNCLNFDKPPNNKCRCISKC